MLKLCSYQPSVKTLHPTHSPRMSQLCHITLQSFKISPSTIIDPSMLLQCSEPCLQKKFAKCDKNQTKDLSDYCLYCPRINELTWKRTKHSVGPIPANLCVLTIRLLSPSVDLSNGLNYSHSCNWPLLCPCKVMSTHIFMR